MMKEKIKGMMQLLVQNRNKIGHYFFVVGMIYLLNSFLVFGGIHLDFLKPFCFKQISNEVISQNIENTSFEEGKCVTINMDPQLYLDYSDDYISKYITIKLKNLSLNGEKVKKITGQIFYVNQGVYTEDNSKRVSFREGINCIKLSKNKDYQVIRIDIGDEANLSYDLEVFYSNRFSDYSSLFLLTFIFSVLYFLCIFFAGRIKIRECAWLKDFCCEFKEFAARRKGVIIGIIIVGCITYTFMISEFSLSLDEENNLGLYTGPEFYVALGRFSSYFLAQILEPGGHMLPTATILLAASLFIFAAILFLFVFDAWCDNKASKIGMIACAGIFISMPYTIGQVMSFASFSIYIAIAMCAMAMSIYLITKMCSINKVSQINKGMFCSTIILMVIAIGMYQTFITVYITLCVGYILFLIFKKEKIEVKDIIQIILKYVVILSISFICYEILNQICYNFISDSTAYLTNTFVGWNKHMSNEWTLHNVFNNMYLILRGEYYNLYAGLSIKITMIAWLIYYLLKCRFYKLWENIVIFCLMIFFIVSPFLLSLAMGTFVMVGRQLIALSLMIGMVWFIILSEIKIKQITRVVAGAISLYLVFYQAANFNQVIYCDQLRYKHDTETAALLINDLKHDTNMDKPVVFLGRYSYDSEWYMNYANGMESFFDTGEFGRITTFLNVLGYNVQYAPYDYFVDAQQYKGLMSNWPKDGSILETDNYIIVKFSDE